MILSKIVMRDSVLICGCNRQGLQKSQPLQIPRASSYAQLTAPKVCALDCPVPKITTGQFTSSSILAM